ncbi:peroxiredoxin family protein [Myxococcus fulvus]|uniref:peroxiredoxin family protein n=1 Tax=Myxococcus TaxID=32 RepID=UPI0020BDA7D8|nr:peroxiredoxin family protein [Myxococcus fulvus]MCK8497990.1 peroxiredoxin family protein [Myxococcus fulvus]
MKTWITGTLAAALLSQGALASNLPDGPQDATLRTSSGEEVRLSRWRGKPVILFYEDKDSTKLNAGLKEELFARGKERNLLGAATVVAVANLMKFDFFPARQIALSYVRDEEKKVGVPILVDLKGAMGEAPWTLPLKTSNVLLLDAQGVLIYRHSGKMKPEEQTAFFESLSKLVGVDLTTPVAAPAAPGATP